MILLIPILTVDGEPVLEAFAKLIRPLVVNVPVHDPPEPIPEIVPTVALVLEKPEGIFEGGAQVPEAESQISIRTDLMVVEVGGVNAKV